MSQFQAPPTYAELLLVDPKSGKAAFNPIWLNWFISLTQNIGATGPVNSVTASGGLSSSGGANPNITITSVTGVGAVVLATGPTLTAPVLGAATGTSLVLSSFLKGSANGTVDLGAASVGFKRLYLDFTNTATVGNVTINKASGRVNLGAGGTTLTLTNSLITAASRIFLNADSAPGNLVAVQFYAVAAAGSCTINAVPAVTNQTAIDFLVVNAD